jgi:twitching motility protein PilT
MTLTIENPDAKLSSFLVANGHLGAQQAADLMADSARTGMPLVNRLVAARLVSQQVLAQGLASVAGLKYVPPSHLRPAPRAIELLSGEQAREVRGLPILVDPSQVVIAFALPPTADQLSQVRSLVRRPVVPVIAEIDALRRAMQAAYYGVSKPDSPPPAAPTGPTDGTAREGEGDRHDAAPLHIDELLESLLEMHGSDLHLAAGAKPAVRVHGELRVVDRFARLDSDRIKKLIYDILNEKQIAMFEHDLELDTAYAIPSQSRFRMNVFRQRGSIGAVLRVIPFEIPPFDGLGLPPAVRRLTDLPRGLVLVTGPTGSGKSTTLAAMLDIINRSKAVHIMSCEDPIEFLHTHQRAIVNQREVGQDTRSFASALRRVLREDPDVILVGEMRDLETIHMALTAAETGHLVFGTLHTQSAPQTVDRIIDVFPPEQQGQIRVMLATTLQAVITQQLVPGKEGTSRVVAAEVLIATPAVRNLIRDGKGYQIPTQMQAGAQFGMVTMDQSLAALVQAGRVSYEMAVERAANVEDLRDLLGMKGREGSGRQP